MIFTIKQEDLRHKARLVVNGNVVDASAFNKYSPTIKTISVRLIFLIAVYKKLNIMTSDVMNAFPTAPCRERIWSKTGPEFGDRQGSLVTLNRALYGLPIAAISFHDFLGDTLRRIGFIPSRADQKLWIIKAKDYDGYDYLATHVDDLIVAAKRPG